MPYDDRIGESGRGHAVRWDAAEMTTRCGRVPGATFSREEISLLVAERTVRTGEGEVTVPVSDRIILSPYTAKRLLVLLGTILARRELQSMERPDVSAERVDRIRELIISCHSQWMESEGDYAGT